MMHELPIGGFSVDDAVRMVGDLAMEVVATSEDEESFDYTLPIGTIQAVDPFGVLSPDPEHPQAVVQVAPNLGLMFVPIELVACIVDERLAIARHPKAEEAPAFTSVFLQVTKIRGQFGGGWVIVGMVSKTLAGDLVAAVHSV